MHIALLGGSFNPPHVGHLLAAHYVWATRPIERLWLVPVFKHPFGKSLLPFEHRVAMCERVVADFAPRFEVSRVEAELGGEGRTVDTLELLRRTRPSDRFSIIVGTDLLPEWRKWKDFDRIGELAEVIVVARAGHPTPVDYGPAMPEVSSTEIRERLRQGADVSRLVPRAVLDYIREQGLYGSSLSETSE